MVKQLINDRSAFLWYCCVSVGGLLIFIIVTWLYVLWETSQTLDLPEAEVVFEVPQGAPLSRVAAQMKERGWISSGVWLDFYGRMTSYQGQVKAGEYLVSTGMTPRSVLQLLRSGKVIIHRFTIIEGWTFVRILQALAEEHALRQTLTSVSRLEIAELLGIDANYPEGYFFPDTYQFTKGETDFSILKQSYERMHRVLEQEWSQYRQDLGYKSPYEALILASIIEKETALEADRTKIAAVFLHRLQRGMRLQSDPTVIYGLGADFNGNLTRRDLQSDTLYNTYINKGLPPTPICSPGRSSIRAALFPANISSLYFVSRGDGSSEFSDTLEEHNQAVRKYQMMGSNR